MATSKDDRKRKSQSSETDESRKKRKEGDKSRSKNKHSKSRRSRRGSTASDRKKVRSISELVKLVIAGEVNVPKSLNHYVGDRNQLLDQVFTILSESDVRGMLPDILKGLKVKHIRQLCLDQLKNMTAEEVAESLGTQPTVKPLNVDATVFKLLGSETTKEDGDERGGGVCGTDQAEQEGEERSDIATKIDLESGCTSGELGKNRASPLPCEEKEQSVVCVSDVSEDEGTVTGSRMDVGSQEGAHSSCSPTLTMECDTTTTELSTDCHARSGRGDGEGEVDSEDSMSTGSGSSLSDLDDCWLCEFPAEVSEWARLQEVEFRQRALEAELRRSGEWVNMQTEDRGKKKEERVSVSDKGEREGVPNTSSPAATAKLDKSMAIEVQLRQRALQSLLAKKKQQNL